MLKLDRSRPLLHWRNRSLRCRSFPCQRSPCHSSVPRSTASSFQSPHEGLPKFSCPYSCSFWLTARSLYGMRWLVIHLSLQFETFSSTSHNVQHSIVMLYNCTQVKCQSYRFPSCHIPYIAHTFSSQSPFNLSARNDFP